MKRTYLNGLFPLLLALICSAVYVQGQSAPVRGIVKLQQADGTQVPAPNVLVEPFRVDLDQGKLPGATTNKNGEFSFAAFTFGHRYVLAVSGPGYSPTISRTVQAGNDSVVIVVNAGDGRHLAEAEVRELIKASSNPQAAQSASDQKKAQEEYQKQLAKYNEEKSKVENVNKVVNAALKDGDAAFKTKDYTTAIAKFDEGINADPEFEGSAPILLNYKGVALKSRGFEAYERASKADAAIKASEMEKAKADFLASMDAYEKGLKILASAKAADAAAQASYDKSKYNILNNYVESFRLIVRTKADVSKAKEAVPVYEQYFTAETDPAKKLAARVVLADMLREAGESESAIAEYRTVLETAPDNPDALAGIGLSLFNVGVSEDNKPKMQEGLNFMQKFADTAPDTHPLKQSVKDAVDYLKTEQKLAPQKTAAPKRKT